MVNILGLTMPYGYFDHMQRADTPDAERHQMTVALCAEYVQRTRHDRLCPTSTAVPVKRRIVLLMPITPDAAGSRLQHSVLLSRHLVAQRHEL